MNKQQLIENFLANKSAKIETKSQATRVINALIEEMSKGIKKDGELQIIGFGTFRVKARAARSGRNPATGDTIKIKASKNVSFKAGAALKASVARTKAK